MSKSSTTRKHQRSVRELGRDRKRGGGRPKRRRAKTWGVFDFETDPFKHGRKPEPFAAAIRTDTDYESFWGDDCAAQLARWIIDNPGTYYAHNGGKFDFHYLLEFVERSQLRVINGRIAKMRLGQSTLVDSFCIAPFGLGQYNKLEIDYAKFERHRREKHRLEITRYLAVDCEALYAIVEGFHERLGEHLTIGGAAFARLKELGYDIPTGNQTFDARFRRFYYGGRCEAFKTGHHRRVRLDYFDINSAYPWSMLSEHPWSLEFDELGASGSELRGYDLVELSGRGGGSLPHRSETGKIVYDDERRTFYATGWEVIAGLETGALRIDSIATIYRPTEVMSFGEFVEQTYAARLTAKQSGDRVGELAYKFLLNSAYGKFATNPQDFKDYTVVPYDECQPVPWEFERDLPGCDFSIWSKPSPDFRGYYNVATAASITGKVRSHLWSSLSRGEAWYCDTDSIIGKGYRDQLPISSKLGDWKDEGVIKEFACAGRKLYAAKVGKDWKVASKGSILSADEVIDISEGGEVIYRRDAPTFSLSGSSFIQRVIKST